MRKNVWCAWWKPELDPDEYIYHYTSFETALKIIYSDQFRLSPLSNTNDTTEQKPRIKYDFSVKSKKKKDIDVFEKYWSQWTTHSKLLCFSRDLPKDDAVINNGDIFDVAGRGFALPRMWAQYAKNNSGVCFIILKKPFVTEIQKAYPGAICKDVTYSDWSNGFSISENLFEELITVISHDYDSPYAQTFLQDNSDFADYAYFSKLIDWKSENEYRILVPSSKEGYLYIEGVRNCLAGLVLGESMDSSLIKTMRVAATQFHIPIRRIVFGLRRCSIENITEDIEQSAIK